MFRNCFAAIWLMGALAFFFIAAPTSAAEVTYPGDSKATSPFGVLDSFFAGASLSGNTVAVTGGTIAGEVSGGIVNGAGIVRDNTVVISGAPAIGGIVSGGRTVSGDAVGNTVTIGGGNLANFVRGGQTVSGKALSNTVTLNGGGITGAMSSLQGGYSLSGEASNNTVRLYGGSVSRSAVGGQTHGSAAAANNRIELYNAVIGHQLLGGYAAASGNAADNVVEMRGGSVADAVVGGWAENGGVASGNRVTVSGGHVGSSVYGGLGRLGSAVNNTAEIQGGDIVFNVYGGSVTSGSGNADKNTVVFSGGTVGASVIGGQTRETGGSGTTNNNTVFISGGTVNSTVYGGENRGTGASSNNRVAISGGHLGFNIYGGYSNGGAATGNIVELSGAPNLSASTIYGGRSVGLADFFTGNTLTAVGVRGPVVGIHNFERYNFFLPADLGNGQTMFSVTGGASTNMTGTTVNLLGIGGGGEVLNPGDDVVLIGKATGIPAVVNASNVPKGAALLYDFDVSTTGGVLRAAVRSKRANPDAEILPAGPAASAAFLGQSSELITRLPTPEEKRAGITAYAVTSGGSYSYSDPSLDVNGVSVLTGLNWNSPEKDNTRLGVFFEAGSGKYDAAQGDGRLGSVEGDGEIRYHGGGVLGVVGLPAGLYAEGSLRAGRVHTDFGSDYTREALGQDAGYDLSSSYYGAHAGIGGQGRITENTFVDVYGKYLWLKQEGSEASVLGDSVRFDSVDSQRVKTGVRFSYAFAQGFIPYIGAAYEYELDGESRAEAEGVSLASSSLRGGTGIGEAGVAYRGPEGLYVELSGKGFTGTTEGGSGELTVGVEF